MVNERHDDKHESQEEGEYHFSDEQANYEMEPDASTVAAASSTGSLANNLKQHRRIIIGMVVFTTLLGIVYKLIMPSATAPATDFSAPTPKATVIQTTPTQQAVRTVSPPVIEQPAAVTQVQSVAPTTTTPPPPITTSQAPTALQSAPVGANESPDTHNILLEKITTSEQQNSAMINLLQTQYTQKIGDMEIQNNQLRATVQELNARVGSMEVAFRQLTKILRDMRVAGRGNDMTRASQVRNMQPKISYAVQAIIPGRAWLKSDSGDTVTVAEGDMLKDFGRITKIDPYDGIVNIDTGNKMITLSYGANGD